MHKYDYSFLDEGLLPAEMVKSGSIKKIGQARNTKYVNAKYLE